MHSQHAYQTPATNMHIDAQLTLRTPIVTEQNMEYLHCPMWQHCMRVRIPGPNRLDVDALHTHATYTPFARSTPCDTLHLSCIQFSKFADTKVLPLLLLVEHASEHVAVHAARAPADKMIAVKQYQHTDDHVMLVKSTHSQLP